MIKSTYIIIDMNCPSCVMKLEGIEDHLPGITSISANFQKQLLSIEYDENLIKEEQITSEILRMGYHFK